MTILIAGCLFSFPTHAAVNIPLTVNLSETVNVTGTPRIAVDVGGTTRYATYTSGTGSNALTFTLAPQAGDVDLDGVTVSSPIDLNGGTITDTKGNNATLTFTPPSTTNVKVNYPSLGMDFVYDADGRYTLNGTVYNDLTSFLSAAGGTFTRASIGTYYDSTGTLQTAASGVPRFDYDPVTHAAKGILIEESRTNLLTRSSEFDNASWFKSIATVTANVTLAPDGTLTGDKFIPTTTFNQHTLQMTPSLTLGLNYTWSIYAKAGEYHYIGLASYNASQGYFVAYVVDLLDGSTVLGTGKTKNVGNGWYRISSTGIPTSASGYWVKTYPLLPAAISSSASGDGTSGVYVWGAQLELGAFPTSYIPTTTAAVTRAADTVSVPVGAWTDLTKGTLYNEGYQSYLVTSHPTYLSSLGTGTSSDFIATYLTTSAAKSGALNVGGTDYYNLGSGTYIAGNLLKSAITYKANDFRMSADGSLAAPVASGPIPSTTLLRIGDRDGTRTWNGTLKQIKYYPARVTDTQLQLLTQ